MTCLRNTIIIEFIMQNMNEKFRPRDITNRDNILLFGPSSSNREKLIASIYDPKNAKSTTVAFLPFQFGATVVSLDNSEAMLVGGYIYLGEVCTRVNIFDCKSRLTRSVVSLNLDRWCPIVFAVGSSALAFGGFNQRKRSHNECRSDFEIFSRSQNRWNTFPDLSIHRSNIALVSIPSGHVLAIGGSVTGVGRNYISLDAVEMCQIPNEESESSSNVSWKRVSSLREARTYPTAAFFQGKVIVTGGWENIASVPSRSVEIFYPVDEKGQWYSLNKSLDNRVYRLSLVFSSGILYSFGHGPLTVERLESTKDEYSEIDFSTNDWESLPSLTSFRALHGAVSI